MTSRMIVLVTTSFPITGDGSEAAGAFVADLAEELATHLHVRVVAPGENTLVEAWSDNLEIFRYAAPKRPLSTLKMWRPSDFIWMMRVLSGGRSATRNAIKGADHIMALWALPCGDWARHAGRRQGTPYSVWTLGSDIWTLGKIPVLRSYLRIILRGASRCWSDGMKLSKDTQAIAGRPVDFLPSTRRIEQKRAQPRRTQAPYRLLFLGRWHQNKGIDLLLQSLDLLSEEDWGRIEKVTIAGGGPLEATVRIEAKKLRDAGHPVEILGYLPREQSQESMCASDFLLIPSRIESIPLVFSDAIKLGLPVIAMPTGDLIDLVMPEIGILSKQIDSAAFAIAIRDAIAIENKSYALEGLAEKFKLDSIAESIISATFVKADD